MVRLSFIIPSYGDGKNVLKLVDQINKNNLNDFEIIISESGNSNYDKRFLKNFLVVRSKKGRAIQMNFGASKSKGDILIFLHADSDISRIDFSKFEDINSEDFWACFKIKFDSKKWYFRFIEFTSNFRKKYFGAPFGDQGFVVSRNLFRDVGGFPVGGFEDIDISKKLMKRGKPEMIMQPIISSSRRFLKHGIIRTHFLMGLVVLFYVLSLKRNAKRLYSLIS